MKGETYRQYILLRIIGSFFFFLILINSHGQDISNDVYMESLWDTIDLATSQEIPVCSDTMLVLCTTRTYNPSLRQKFGYHFDPLGTVRYLLALRKSGRWKMYPMSSMKEAASYLDPAKDLVFYIEGMGKTFTSNLYRAVGLSLQYNVNVIVFDYPSVHPDHSLLRNFKTARRNATDAFTAYVLFLKTIQENKKEKWMSGKQITLLQHSMGNRMLKKSIETNSLGEIQPSLINRLILNAPCVDQKRHAEWVSKINFADQIVVHYNTKDSQLYWASVLTFSKQLGAKVKKPYAKNVQYVHFNELAHRQHSVFLNRPGGPNIAPAADSYYKMLFHDPVIDWQNPRLFGLQKKNPGVSLKPW